MTQVSKARERRESVAAAEEAAGRTAVARGGNPLAFNLNDIAAGGTSTGTGSTGTGGIGTSTGGGDGGAGSASSAGGAGGSSGDGAARLSAALAKAAGGAAASCREAVLDMLGSSGGGDMDAHLK